jgi:glycerate kinase
MHRRILIAPDSFKGTATAREVAEALAAGWRSVRPDDVLTLVPMADGGEGTVDALAEASRGAVRHSLRVTGPDDRVARADWLMLSDGTAVVELAATSGITLLDPLRPHDAHTVGFGEAIAAALDAGAQRLLLAIGGSSSTDGGAGALMALGARFLSADGTPIRRGNRGLADLDRVDVSRLRPLPPGGAVVLSDVTNPLLGAQGAAAVYGPQKGATRTDVVVLEANLARLAVLLPADPRAPGAGAAGGTGFGLLAWGAGLESGAQAIAGELGLPGLLEQSDLLVTGEGRFDGQSASGKVVSHLRSLAVESEVGTALIAGQIAAPTDGFRHSISLSELAGSERGARAETIQWLTRAGAALASESR